MRYRLALTLLVGLAVVFPEVGCAQEISITKDGKAAKGKWKVARLVPPEEKFIEEKSLEFDSNASKFAPPEPGGDRANGAKFYAFLLSPKERLSIQLKGESANHVGLKAMLPAIPDAMEAQFERTERMPRALRSKVFEVQNVTEKPYTVMLMVYGTVNYWFNLTIDRKL